MKILNATDLKKEDSEPPRCPPRAVYTNNGYEAMWGGEAASFDGANYGRQDNDPSNNCFYYGQEPLKGFNGWKKSAESFSCGNGDLTEEKQNYCDQLRDNLYLGDSNEAPVAVYYPDYSEDLPDLGTGEGTINRGIVNSNGWVEQYQPLYKAEATYDGDHEVVCRVCLHKDTWNDVGDKDLQNANSSYGTGPEDVENRDDAWIPANPKAENPRVSDSSFPGGWAGKCPVGQEWQKRRGEWTCSGSLRWTQEVYFPNTTHQGDEARVGFYVMHNNFNKQPDSGTSYREGLVASGESSSVEEAPKLDVLHAVCWKGKVSDKPSSFNEPKRGVEWFSVKYEGLSGTVDRPVPVFGELEVESSTSYSCEWKYEDSVGNVVTDEGNVIPLTKGQFETGISDVSLPDGVSGVTEVSNSKKRNLDDFLYDWMTGSSSGLVQLDASPSSFS